MICQRKIYLFFLFLIFFQGCTWKQTRNSEVEDTVRNWHGRELLLPMLDDNQSSGTNNRDIKVVTRVNGDCYSCILKLNDWQDLIEEISLIPNVSFYFYIVTLDSVRFLDLLKTNPDLHFNNPVLFDPYDKFRRINELPVNNIYHTMLIDSNNKILIIGDPIINSDMKNLYKKTIINMNENECK